MAGLIVDNIIAYDNYNFIFFNRPSRPYALTTWQKNLILFEIFIDKYVWIKFRYSLKCIPNLEYQKY